MPQSHDRFTHSSYTLRQKVLKILGAAVHIYGPDDELVFYSKMKAFKLREDIRLYSDDSMSEELLSIQARQIIDFSAAYDVFDPVAEQVVGSLRRKGLKSMFKDEWLLHDAEGLEVGVIKEDSLLHALLRRNVEFVALLLPQKYHVEINGASVCELKRNFNPFVNKVHIDFSGDVDVALDPRLGIAAAMLLCVVEGKQG